MKMKAFRHETQKLPSPQKTGRRRRRQDVSIVCLAFGCFLKTKTRRSARDVMHISFASYANFVIVTVSRCCVVSKKKSTKMRFETSLIPRGSEKRVLRVDAVNVLRNGRNHCAPKVTESARQLSEALFRPIACKPNFT